MTRWSVAPIALSTAVSLAAVVSAAPARAADEIGLSPDGVVWYDALHRPLFDAERRWVPGDAETASFYVRNAGNSAAQLTIEVRSADGAGLLADDDIEITARSGVGRWHQVHNGLASSWLTDNAIAEGGRVRVDVKVQFVRQASNGTMLERLPLDFEVRLVQASGSDGPANQLPDTGSAVSPLVIWLGAALLGSGLALVVAARKKCSEESVSEDDESVVEAEVLVHG